MHLSGPVSQNMFVGFVRRIPSAVWIAGFGVLITAATWLFTVRMTANDLELETRRINSENGALARVLEEHVARAVKLTDNALLFLKREYEARGTITQRMTSFVAEARQDPLLNQVGLVNAKGDLGLSAVSLTRPVNIAHREHFQVQAASDTVGLFIGKPVLNLVSGVWSIFLTRRLNRPDGAFAGVVTAGIDPRYFTDYFDAPELGPDRTIVLVGRDGVIRARKFQQQSALGQDISSSPLFERIRSSETGSYEVVSLIDGLTRLASYHAVPGTSLIVTVGTLKKAALAPFRKRKRITYTIALVFTFFTAGFCVLLIRSVCLAGRQNELLAAELAERERSATVLRERERQLAESQRIAHIGSWEHDPTTGRMVWSEELFHLLGIDPRTDPCDLALFIEGIHPDDRPAVKNAFDEILQTGTQFSVDYRFLLRDGTTKILHTQAERKSGATGTQVTLSGTQVTLSGTVQDVTERQKMEEQVRTAQKLESVGVLAAGIAHDFNNLLGVILGNVSLAKMLLPADAQQRQLLQNAEAGCEHGRELSGRLLTFAKGGEPFKKTVLLRKTLGDSVQLSLSGSNVSAVFNVADGLRAVDADEGQLRQVFSNLAINAKEAMPGGGTVEVGVENQQVAAGAIPGLRQGEFVKITFRDQGGGIPRQVVGRIFDPYFSTKEMGSRKGQGLGLTICDSIVKKHGGLITVATELGKGTVFTIYLPASEYEVAKEEGVSARSVGKAQSGGKILVMDDDAGVRDILGWMLKHLGHTVDLFPDSAGTVGAYREALAAGAPYNLVILDLTIQGGKGGAETFRDLQALDPHVRAIISSGYADDPILENYKEHGFVAAITKPYATEQLKQALASIAQLPVVDG